MTETIQELVTDITLDISKRDGLNILYVETIQRNPSSYYPAIGSRPLLLFDLYYCMSLYGTIKLEIDLHAEQVHARFNLKDKSELNLIN